MHSIQKIQGDRSLVFGSVNYIAPKTDSINQNNNISGQKNNKTKYITTTLGCMAVAGIAVLAIRAKSKPSFKQFNDELFNLSAFFNQADKANIKSPEGFISNCIESNIIGSGQNSVVYKFSNPLMENWVIKISKSAGDNFKDYFYLPLRQIQDDFAGYNMGQPIAGFGENVKILKRIKGKPHSIENWAEHRRAQIEITPQQASDFISDLKQIAKFPQESFDDFAKKLKLIDENKGKADSFNPNNFLINFKEKRLNIIDWYYYNVDEHINTKYDLICPLVDYPNFGKYYKTMNTAQKADYIKLTEIIAKKCTMAAEKVGLKTSEDVFRDFIGRVDARENNGQLYTKSFDAMKNICKDIVL